MSCRRFMRRKALRFSALLLLKTVGVSSQREVEHAVAKAIADGSIAGTETLPATMTLQIGALKLLVSFDGEIKLQ